MKIKLLLLFLVFNLINLSAQWNSPVQVDNSADVGQYTSLVIVNGNPAISYYDVTNSALYFVRASNADGTAWNSPVEVDNSADVGQYNSLAIVNGNPAISFYDGTSGRLKFVRADNADGSSWNTAPVTVENSFAGTHTSLTIVNGNPAISYKNAFNTDLYFVRASDANGTTWNTPVLVDNSVNVHHTSLMIVNSNPAISYYDETNTALMFVRASNADGTAWNSPVQVDNAAAVGQYTSLAIVNGNPAISYYDATNTALNYVQASNVDGTAWNTPAQVDNAAAVGQYTSLNIVNGNPAISYFDDTSDALKFARATDVDGTDWCGPMQVDNSGAVGQYTSLAIVNGNPAISYYDITNSALNYVRSNIDFSQGGLSLTVNDLGDASDSNIGDGICSTAGGVCTLRAALEEANAYSFSSSAASPATISINQSGTINISSSLPNIGSYLTLTGHSSGNTIFDNGALGDHILQITPSNCDNMVATISNLIFDGGDTGGIDISGGTANFSNCVFKNVSGSNEQAMVVRTNGTTVTLNQCSFLDNTSNQSGGAMEILNDVTVTATNCTFSGNSNRGNSNNKRGGAIYIATTTAVLNLVNCTIVNNEAGISGGGGGVFVLLGTLNLTNTLIANNTEANASSTNDNDLEFLNNAGAVMGTNTTNLVEICVDGAVGQCPVFTSSNDPNLAAAATCGMPAQTYYEPQSGSDAIDMGTAGTSLDICGSTRQAPLDIGSYEIISNPDNALDFDGSDDYVDCGNINALNNASWFTLEVWANYTTPGSGQSDFISKHFNSSNNVRLYATPTQIYMHLEHNVQTAHGFVNFTNNGAWNHFAMVFDGAQTGNANRLKLYINGVQQTLSFSGNIPATTDNNSAPVRLGSANGSANFLDGTIDEVRIWNIALEAADIANLYNDSFSDPTSPASCLVAYYQMSDGSGTTLTDDSGNSNTGTLMNMDNADWVASGASTTSETAPVCSTLFPVELINFRAQNQDHQSLLTWQTATETNNQGFEIEWSTDSQSWQNIGFVQGAGDSFDKQSYSFIHENPREGINYYRLLQVDFDGAFEYSNVVSVDLLNIGSLANLSVIPNPVQGGSFTLYLPENLTSQNWEVETENLHMEIYNVSGRMIRSQILYGNENEVMVNNLASGIYLIQVQVDAIRLWNRIIIE